MKRNNLLFALDTLDEKELTELATYIQFSFLDLREVDRKILNYLIREGTARRKDEEPVGGRNVRERQIKFKKRVCREALKGEHSGAFKQWARILSRCFIAVNEFILFKLTRNGIVRNNILLDYYTDNNDGGKIFKALHKNLDDELNKDGNRDYYYHYNMFRMNHYSAINDKNIEDTTEVLQKCSSNLDAFYFENKLRIHNEFLIKKVDSSIDSQDDLMDAIVTDSSHLNDFEIRMIRMMNLFLSNGEEINLGIWFSEIRDDKFSRLDIHLKKTILGYFLNYCAISVNEKKEEYIKLYLDGIDFLDKENLLLDTNEIPWKRYQTIISFFMIENRNKEAELFMIKYANHLNLKYRLSAEILAKASISEDSPNGFVYENIWERIPYERLLMKYYIKQKNFRLLKNQMKPFNLEVWRKQGKVSENTYNKVKGFLRMARKIVKQYEEDKFIENANLDLEKLNNTDMYGIDYIWLKRNFCKKK